MLNLTLLSSSIPSYDSIHEGDNNYLQLKVNDFGEDFTPEGTKMWVICRVDGNRVFTDGPHTVSLEGNTNPSFTVPLQNCMFVSDGKLEIQVVITNSSDNLLTLMEAYNAGTTNALIIKSRVYEFYINPSLDPSQELVPSSGNGISQAVRDYLDDLVSQVIEEGFELNIDTELSSSSRNPVENRVIKTALDEKANAVHNHDDRYYTETETNAALAGKADVNHAHDDRYYTEAEIEARVSNSIILDGSSTTKFATPKAVRDYVAGSESGSLYAGEQTFQGVLASGDESFYSIALPDLGADSFQPIMDLVLRNRTEELFLSVRPYAPSSIADRFNLECSACLHPSPYVAVLYFEGVYDDKRYSARIAIKPRNSTSTLTPFDCSLDASYRDFTDGDATVQCTIEATLLKVEPIFTEDDLPEPPTVPTKVSDLQNDSGFLTDTTAATAGYLKTVSALAAGFCQNVEYETETTISAVNIGNMPGGQSELQNILFYHTFLYRGQCVQGDIFDTWDALVYAKDHNLNPRYQTEQGNLLPLTYVNGRFPYFAYNVEVQGYDGAQSGITLLDIYVPDTTMPAVLIQIYPESETDEATEIHAYFSEDRRNDLITFKQTSSYIDRYAKERYVDSAIDALKNGLTLKDTATGTMYKLTVVNGQLSLSALS